MASQDAIFSVEVFEQCAAILVVAFDQLHHHPDKFNALLGVQGSQKSDLSFAHALIHVIHDAPPLAADIGDFLASISGTRLTLDESPLFQAPENVGHRRSVDADFGAE
jgi:hypothetical protein